MAPDMTREHKRAVLTLMFGCFSSPILASLYDTVHLIPFPDGAISVGGRGEKKKKTLWLSG